MQVLRVMDVNSNRLELLKDYEIPIKQGDLSSYTLVGLFEEICDHIPDELALKQDLLELSYADVNQKANALGHVLIAKDPSPSQPVVALAKVGYRMSLIELGILKARKILVGIAPDNPFDGTVQIIRDSKAETLVYESEHHQLAVRLADELGLSLINFDECLPGTAQNLGLEYLSEDLISLVYTSGSTGKPKAIIKSNATILHSVGVHAAMGMDARDRFFSIYHFSYANGIGAPFKAWLLGGVSFPYDLNQRGLAALIDLIRDEKITVYHSPPSVFRNFIKAVSREDLANIRWVHLGGEPVYARDIELFKEKFPPGSIIFNNLGSSEAPSILRFLMNHETDLEDDVVPVGYPTERTQLMVVDDQGIPVQQGQVGELVVRSRYLASGYWNNPRQTAEMFRPIEGSAEKIFKTGDLVYQRADGCYVYAGRKDSQVKIRGSRVVVADVEAAITRISGVWQAVIRVDQTAGGTSRLVAYVIPDPDVTLIPADLRRLLAEKLPRYMLPHQVILMSEFPKTTTGKVDRTALPSVDMSRPDLQNALEPPATEVEKQLVGIWKKLFQMDSIGVTDNFFDLGGDSLLAVELFVEIEKAFHRRFPISLLIKASNIRQQAEFILRLQQDDPWLPLVEFNSSGNQVPLFCFAGKGGNPIKFRQMAINLGENQPVYFLQARGLSGEDVPLASVEEIADDYVHAMRRVQADGPYRLLGSSFGGKVAFEVGSILSRQGETIDFVMMLDTYGPGYPVSLKNWSKAARQLRKAIIYFRKHWQSLTQGNWRDRKAYFRYYKDLVPVLIQSRRQDRQRRAEEKKRQDALPGTLKLVEQTNLQASRQYHPGSFPGKVVLLRATQQPPYIEDNYALGWEKVEIGELKVHPVDGHHGNLLVPPSLNAVVDILQAYINPDRE